MAGWHCGERETFQSLLAQLQTFYDRYRAGEHIEVWSELIGLRDAVRTEPIYSDAMTVARETKRRARKMADRMKGLLNLAAKMPAVQAEALERLKATAAKPRPAHPRENPNIYCRATAEAPEEIANAERRLGGPLPLSLAVWYETIGQVSLLGSHPDLNPTQRVSQRPTMFVSSSILDGPGGQQRRRLAESLGIRVTSQMPEPSLNDNPLPDPLMIAPLEDLVGEVDEGGGS